MWRPSMKTVTADDEAEELDAWELARAFAEDTRSTNWPPRLHTCTFCRREFRSAQALGGHMNVHRRDRAHLHQSQALAQAETLAQTTSNGSISPSDMLLNWPYLSDGSALFYQLTNYGANNTNCFEAAPSFEPNYSLPATGFVTDQMQEVTDHMSYDKENHAITCSNKDIVKLNKEEVAVEELDLELRLGHIPASGGSSRLMKSNSDVAVLHWR